MSIYFAIAISSAFTCVTALAERILYEKIKIPATILGWIAYIVIALIPSLFVDEDILTETFVFIVVTGYLVQQILLGSKQPDFVVPTIEEKKLLFSVLLLIVAYYAAT